jgi:hypothetical protein
MRAGVASEADVQDALDEGNRRGEKLGQVALRRGWVSQRKLAKLLADQWGLRAPNPTKLEMDPAALARIDAGVAAELGGLPVAFDEQGLVVAVAEPTAARLDALRALLGDVSFIVVPPSTLTALLNASKETLGKPSSPVDLVEAWLAPTDVGQQIVEEPDGSTASVGRDNDEEEPMSSIDEPQEEAQLAAHEPAFTAVPQPSSVVEHLHALIGAVEALDNELIETRGRLAAQETDLAELGQLRHAHASDLETINNLRAELEDRRSRMDAIQAATRQLAAEFDI